MKVISKKENPLLKRQEYIFEIDHISQPTLNKEKIQKSIVDSLKVDKDLIKVKHIYTKYGTGTSKVIANVYKDKKTLDEIEKVKKKKEEKPKEEKKPEKKEEVKEAKENGKEEKSKEQTAK